MSIDSIIIYVLIACVIFLLAEMIRLNMRLKKVLLGKKGQDLEETLIALVRGMENLDGRSTKAEQIIMELDERLKKSIQKVHTVRFNPFRDQGSNQSFTTALMDESGDGVVISSLYSRDKVSVYAKPLNHYESEYELSGEEREAIEKAR
ncbi:MAG: DUF4446 family protein [Patescibacteria group bacterium]